MNAAARPELTIEAFEGGAIDAPAFDHEAHIYVGWLYLEEYPLLEAVARFTDAIRRLTVQLGVPGKYHETITWFFLFLIDERRRQGSGADWFGFRRDNADLFATGDDSILARYYETRTLSADSARQSFVLPDRLAP